MKIKLPLFASTFVTILSLVVVAPSCFAVGENASPLRLKEKEITVATPQDKLDSAGKGTERWEQRKIKVRQKITSKIKEHSKVLLDRYYTAIARLEKIIIKIEERIAEDKTKGLDTSKAEGDLALAKTNLADTKTAIETAKTQIDAVTPEGQENEIANTLKQVREVLKAQKQKLIEVRQNLKTVVEDLKALKQDTTENLNGGE